jgi:hypothetical protein
VPVTAKLSRKFYEKLGDDVANELVEWFNMVDATYRGELRDLNDHNFARFDAKLEQRVGELDAKIDQRVAELRAEMQAGFSRSEALLGQRLAEFETRLTRRMFNFWVAQAATTIGLLFAAVKLAR